MGDGVSAHPPTAPKETSQTPDPTAAAPLAQPSPDKAPASMPGKASSSRPVALNEMGTGTVWTAPGPRLHPGPSGIRCCPPAGTPHPRPRHLRALCSVGRVSPANPKNCPRVVSVDGQGWGKPSSPPALSHRPLLPLAPPGSSGSGTLHLPQHCWCPLPAPAQSHACPVRGNARGAEWERSHLLHSEPGQGASLAGCSHSPAPRGLSFPFPLPPPALPPSSLPSTKLSWPPLGTAGDALGPQKSG